MIHLLCCLNHHVFLTIKILPNFFVNILVLSFLVNQVSLFFSGFKLCSMYLLLLDYYLFLLVQFPIRSNLFIKKKKYWKFNDRELWFCFWLLSALSRLGSFSVQFMAAFALVQTQSACEKFYYVKVIVYKTDYLNFCHCRRFIFFSRHRSAWKTCLWILMTGVSTY